MSCGKFLDDIDDASSDAAPQPLTWTIPDDVAAATEKPLIYADDHDLSSSGPPRPAPISHDAMQHYALSRLFAKIYERMDVAEDTYMEVFVASLLKFIALKETADEEMTHSDCEGCRRFLAITARPCLSKLWCRSLSRHPQRRENGR